MARKDDVPWLLIGAFAAGLFWLFGSPAKAATAPAVPATVSSGAQKYLDQIMAAQNAFTGGTKTQLEYTGMVQGIVAVAQIDPTVSASDLSYLRAVAGI
jgi:hypothetical protein